MDRGRPLLTLLALLGGYACLSQTGTLDSSFDEDGIVVTTFGGLYSPCRAVVVQADGKVIIGGASVQGSLDLTLVRYLPNGDPDPGFGTNGIVTTDLSDTGPDQCYALLVQPDGRIVAAGYAGGDFAVARYHPDGTPDIGFGGDGSVIFPVGEGAAFVSSLAVQSDGKVLATGSAYIDGWYDFALARLNQDGSLDQSFGANGIVTATMDDEDDARAVAVQEDGKLLVAGSTHHFPDNDGRDFALLRFNADGTPDATFGAGGQHRLSLSIYEDAADAVIVLPDGRILVTGLSQTLGGNNLALTRFSPDGTLDGSFGDEGIVLVPMSAYFGYEQRSGSVLQADGKILVGASKYVGNALQFALARFQADGSLDFTFDSDGVVNTPVDVTLDRGSAIALAPDGRIVMAGTLLDPLANGEMIVVRYLNDPDIGLAPVDTPGRAASLFPDPTADIAVFSFTIDREGTYSLTVHDAAGQCVLTAFNEVRYAPGKHSETLHLSNLAAGHYTIVLRGAAGALSMNALKQ